MGQGYSLMTGTHDPLPGYAPPASGSKIRGRPVSMPSNEAIDDDRDVLSRSSRSSTSLEQRHHPDDDVARSPSGKFPECATSRHSVERQRHDSFDLQHGWSRTGALSLDVRSVRHGSWSGDSHDVDRTPPAEAGDTIRSRDLRNDEPGFSNRYELMCRPFRSLYYTSCPYIVCTNSVLCIQC